jgi:hypothetical protein
MHTTASLEPLTSGTGLQPPRNEYQPLNQHAQFGSSSAIEADAEAWLWGPTASSLNTSNELSLALQPAAPTTFPKPPPETSTLNNLLSRVPTTEKRRSPHGSMNCPHGSPSSKRTRRRKPLSRQQDPLTTNSSFYEIESNTETTKSNYTKPERVVALLEEAVQQFSTFSKRKAASLISQFKQLIEDEKLYGIPYDDSSDIILTSTSSSSQDCRSISEASDSDHGTDDTSLSSAPSQPKQELRHDMMMDVKRPHTPSIQKGSKSTYYCTRNTCSYSVQSFTDWKRHEEGERHWPQERFMCLQCPTPVSDVNGNPSCQFCRVPCSQFAGTVEAHYLQCVSAQAEGKTFNRKDHLAEHLQNDHSISKNNASPLAATWKYSINSNWPRQCGFCGQRFQDWDQRMKHIAKHYREGSHISTWKLPFPRPRDSRPKGPEFHRRDDGSDGDDDNFDDSHDQSRGKMIPKQRGKSSKLNRVSNRPRTTNQMNNTQLQQNYRGHADRDSPLPQGAAGDRSSISSRNDDIHEARRQIKSTISERPQLEPERDGYIPKEYDEAGERKVATTGHLLDGREYRCRTFVVPNRGDKLLMLATECARVLGYRDSYLMFNKNKSLHKIIATQAEKEDLILQKILPFSYRSRLISIVTAKSMFCQFGSRIIVNGKRVKDDYWEAKARSQGFTEDDLAGEKRPGAGKAREAFNIALVEGVPGSQAKIEYHNLTLEAVTESQSGSGGTSLVLDRYLRDIEEPPCILSQFRRNLPETNTRPLMPGTDASLTSHPFGPASRTVRVIPLPRRPVLRPSRNIFSDPQATLPLAGASLDLSTIASVRTEKHRASNLHYRTRPKQRHPTPPAPSNIFAFPQRAQSVKAHRHLIDELYDIILQPETVPIQQEQLVAELKGIYAGIMMVEAKCIEIDNKQSTLAQANPKASPTLNIAQWQALIAPHRTLLHEPHDFSLASHHPSASPALRRLAAKYAWIHKHYGCKPWTGPDLNDHGGLFGSPHPWLRAIFSEVDGVPRKLDLVPAKVRRRLPTKVRIQLPRRKKAKAAIRISSLGSRQPSTSRDYSIFDDIDDSQANVKCHQSCEDFGHRQELERHIESSLTVDLSEINRLHGISWMKMWISIVRFTLILEMICLFYGFVLWSTPWLTAQFAGLTGAGSPV